MICKYVEIFCWKNVSSFCSAKATHIFSAKNIRILYIESAKTVNEMTLNELVKLTTLWTTGPWKGPFSYLFMSITCWMSIKQCRHWSDAAISGVSAICSGLYITAISYIYNYSFSEYRNINLSRPKPNNMGSDWNVHLKYLKMSSAEFFTRSA